MKPAHAESNTADISGADLFGLYPDAKEEAPTLTPTPKPTKSLPPPRRVKSMPIEDLDEATDTAGEVDLLPSNSDTSDTRIAKRMIERMMADLTEGDGAAHEDMFGHVDGERVNRKLDALIWMYDLNPDGSDLPFTWVCNEIGLDHERIRHITARNVRQELKRILKLLAGMVSFDYAKEAELKISDYVNLTGWNLH